MILFENSLFLKSKSTPSLKRGLAIQACKEICSVSGAKLFNFDNFQKEHPVYKHSREQGATHFSHVCRVS